MCRLALSVAYRVCHYYIHFITITDQGSPLICRSRTPGCLLQHCNCTLQSPAVAHQLIAPISFQTIMFHNHIKLCCWLYFWKWLFLASCVIDLHYLTALQCFSPLPLSFSVCLFICLSLQLSFFFCKAATSCMPGSEGCWGMLTVPFWCWAGENKQGWKPPQSHVLLSTSLPPRLSVLLSLPLSVRDQTNLTSGLKVQLTQTRCSELFLYVLFKYLKPKTSMDLNIFFYGNPGGQVQVTEKLRQK